MCESVNTTIVVNVRVLKQNLFKPYVLSVCETQLVKANRKPIFMYCNSSVIPKYISAY